jgi:protein-disulfide isomerase
VHLIKRSLLALLVLCVGCTAQSNPGSTINSTELNRRIERRVRAQYHLPPQVEVSVGPRTPAADLPSYDFVTVSLKWGEKESERHDFKYLVSKDDKTLVAWSQFDLTVDPYAEIMKKIDLNGRPSRGRPDAKVVIVNYDDFQCPFCAHMHQTLVNEVFPRYADRIRVVYKDFPLPMHQWAIHAAVDANCLAAQSNDAFWSYANYLHANYQEIGGGKQLPQQFEALDRIAQQQGQQFKLDAGRLSGCVKASDDASVVRSLREGEAIGVEATPTIFINGYKIDGALPAAEIEAAIDRALRDASAPSSGGGR